MKSTHMIIAVSTLICLLFVGTFVLTGEIKQSEVQTISDLTEDTEIRFTSSWAGYDTNAGPLNDVLEGFREDNPDLLLVDESMAGEDFLFTLKTDFATGNDPDVFGLWPGSDFDLLVEQGRVADLTQILEDDPEWYNSFSEDAWHYVTVDDRIYGLPFEIIYEGLFINVDMFEAYDVEVPTTYEELKAAVITFKEAGVIPIAFNTTPEGSFIYQNLVMKMGGAEDVEKPVDDKGQLNNSYIKSMYLLKELYDMGAFPEDAFSIDDKERNDLFMEKKAAMIVQGSWFIGEQGLDPNDTTVAVVPFPSLPEGETSYNAVIYGCGNGIFHMSQKAWEDPVKRENSLKLLKVLTSESSAIRFWSAGGFISNIPISEEIREKSYLYDQGEQLINNATELIGPTDSFIDRVLWEEIIVEGFEKMLIGEQTPEDIADEVARIINGEKQ